MILNETYDEILERLNMYNLNETATNDIKQIYKGGYTYLYIDKIKSVPLILGYIKGDDKKSISKEEKEIISFIDTYKTNFLIIKKNINVIFNDIDNRLKEEFDTNINNTKFISAYYVDFKNIAILELDFYPVDGHEFVAEFSIKNNKISYNNSSLHG